MVLRLRAPLATGGIANDHRQRILVPTDFGQTSESALHYGVELARVFGARLHLLHVFDSSTGIRQYTVTTFPAPENEAREQLAELLSGTDRRELRPVCESRLGAPADEILDYALQRNIDLIVMGTHGREGIARALLGSVAEIVVRKATCPVLTVHSPEREVVMEEVRANWCARAAA
jgi:nucleotide-binding universal stress UspA family protein